MTAFLAGVVTGVALVVVVVVGAVEWTFRKGES